MLLSFIHHFIILYKGEKTPIQNIYINEVIEIANSPENRNILLAKTSPFRVGQKLTVSTGGFQLTSASLLLAKLCWPCSSQAFILRNVSVMKSAHFLLVSGDKIWNLFNQEFFVL